MTQNAVSKQVQLRSAEPEQHRDIDPNVLQRRAARPDSSVWVGASAGSGKTKVLTDRVLRLLLPRPDGEPGTKPHKILGITFTKAAAGEMRLRLTRTLSRWAVMVEEDLKEELQNLLGSTPEKEEIAAARKLFAEVIDAAGGLQIMTIHSFCQSVLGRFPLEAGLNPHFTVLDEREAQALLARARDVVLQEAGVQKAGPLAGAVHNIAGAVNDEQFLNLMKDTGRERMQMQNIFEKYFGPEGAYAELCKTLSLIHNQTAEEICLEGCKDSSFVLEALRKACTYLKDSKAASDQGLAESLDAWLSGDVKTRMADFETYTSLYLTNEGSVRKKLVSKALQDNFPESVLELVKEAERIIKLKDKMNAAACALLTRDLLILAQAISGCYQDLKVRRGVLDFDDLISMTLKLLKQKDMAGWVLFKLDQGLDHILIDEAQDTNPEQWKIIEVLTEEFTTGKGVQDVTRTVFTVGDEKQSIYSFQRAAPEEFKRMHENFECRVRDAGQVWENVDLNISFRSTNSVLRAVDATFSGITHHSYRRGQAGLMELWPLYETGENVQLDPWDPPVRIIENKNNGASALADDIAKEIKKWIDNKEILPARGRPVRPEDILILVRTRNAFFRQLTRSLKTYGLPVSGIDRMILNEQLPVEDMLAVAEFSLLPADDLTLAEVLKSPLIGWDDKKLYDIAAERIGTLWDSLKSGPEKNYLEGLIRAAGRDHPFEFFSRILQLPCPSDETSGLKAFKKRMGEDAAEPLDELLNTALSFEQGNIACLQGFLNWQRGELDGLKREMEEPKSEIRIMTVHGAKGLQAPIVILPDTVRASGGGHNDERLLWPDKSGLKVPLWCPRTSLAFEIFSEAKNKIAAKAEEEYKRLLYVAMTRAEDRLYVCGFAGKKKSSRDHWYSMVKTGLENLGDAQVLENGRIRIENPQIREPDKVEKHIERKMADAPVPAWLFKPAPPELSPPRPLIPSRPSENDLPVLSPLLNNGTYRFRRGKLTHKLLELLPEISSELREEVAKTFIARYGSDVPEKIRASIAAETLAVLNHPEFGKIFGPESQAEVPIIGLTKDGRVISGQIDRLLVSANDIWIIDYKTNRPPPKNPANVPLIYLNQMKAYAETLRGIYPGRALHVALLWTDGPFLMKLEI